MTGQRSGVAATRQLDKVGMPIIARILSIVLLLRATFDLAADAVQIQLGQRTIGLGAVVSLLVIGCAVYVVVVTSPLDKLREHAAWAALLLLCMVASLASAEPLASFRSLIAISTYPAMFLLGSALTGDDTERNRFLDILVYSSLVPVLVGLHQVATRGLFEDDFRCQSLFAHANVFAFYLLFTISILIFRLADQSSSEGYGWRLARLAYLCILGALLVSTRTRSAWIGVGAVILIYVMAVDRKKIPLLACLPLAGMLIPAVRERILDAGQAADYVGQGVVLNSYEWRLELWKYAFEWIWRRPLLGHGGLESFSLLSPQFFPLETNPFDAHNVYVQLAFEVGLLGPILLALILAIIIFRCVGKLRTDWNYGMLGIALCSAYGFICYSDNVLDYLPVNWYFWFAAGCLAAQGHAADAWKARGAAFASAHVPARRVRSALTGRLE